MPASRARNGPRGPLPSSSALIVLVAREALPVGRQLGGGHPRGVGAEEELQQRRVAQLGGVAGRLGAPRVERLAARVGDAEHAPPPPALLAPLLGEPGLREPLRLGVERRMRHRPEVADAARDADLELVRGGLAELQEAEDDDGGGSKVHIGPSMLECRHDRTAPPRF